MGDDNPVRTVLAHDPDELARNLTNWEQCYDQISSGRFRGSLAERRLPQMQVFREDIGQSVRQSCRAWPGSIWFGFPLHAAPTRINGRAAASELVLLQAGGSEFELVTPAAYTIFGIVVSRSLLAETVARLGCDIDLERLAKAEVLRVDAAARERCVTMLARVLDDGAAEQGDGAWQLRRQESMAAMLVDMLCTGQAGKPEGCTLQRRQRVIARVREYVAGHRDEAITVPDLCGYAHVSRRTLQYCFEDLLGMSPVVYLRTLRLNGVRRQLMDASFARTPIGELAAAWGFSNFSQFSSDYRGLFGESASASRRVYAQREAQR